MISRPDDNWNIIYDPYLLPNNDFIQIVDIENKNRVEIVSVSKIENIPKDYELLMEQRIKNSYVTFNGHNFKEYHVNTNDFRVYSWAFNACEGNVCSDYTVLEILKVVDSDMFRILAFSKIVDPNTKGALSPEVYEILNSFKVI